MAVWGGVAERFFVGGCPCAKLRAHPTFVASMRVVIRVVVAVFAVVVALSASIAVSAARPVVVHPRWRVVVSELSYAGATDRYVGIVHGYKGAGQLTLID